MTDQLGWDRCCLHTAGATGSIPVPPTKISDLQRARSIRTEKYGKVRGRLVSPAIDTLRAFAGSSN
jgi:hypothetical protein